MRFDSREDLMVSFQTITDENLLDWRKVQMKGSSISSDEDLLQFLLSKNRLEWESKTTKGETKLGFDGTPYLVAHMESYICQQGPDPDKKRKDKQYADKENIMKVCVFLNE